MGLADYPRGLTVNAAESLITRGYKEHMWHHFQSKFFFPEAFVKAHPEILQELFQTFWDNAPKLEPYLEHVIARNRHETGDYLSSITTPTLCLVGSEDKVDADTGNSRGHHLSICATISKARKWKSSKAAATAFSGRSRRRPTGLFVNGWTATDAFKPFQQFKAVQTVRFGQRVLLLQALQLAESAL